MAKALVVAAVVVADAVLLWLDGMPGRQLAGFSAAGALVMVLVARRPLAAFPAAVTTALFSGGSLALLVFTSYQTGRWIGSRRGSATAVIGAVCYLVVLFALTQPAFAPKPRLALARVVVLVGLPMLTGRHLSREQKLLAEQERLRERLRIGRDVHDSLGQLLSVVSVQAAALEVTALPADQQRMVRNIATAARAATDELHSVVATSRQAERPGLPQIDEVISQFRQAGAAVGVERSGADRPLARPDAEHAAYRVVQEGLTNAAKHAPGLRVTVSLDWQPDALLVSVVNPVGEQCGSATGTGLTGLSERVESAGGLLRIHNGPGEFRLVAMLPLAAGATEASA